MPQFCPVAVKSMKPAFAPFSGCEEFRSLVLRVKGHEIKAVLINDSPPEL